MSTAERVCTICSQYYPAGYYTVHRRTPRHIESYLEPGRRDERRRRTGQYVNQTKTERNEAIVEAVRSGRLVRDVAAEYNLTFQRVSQIARRAGVGHPSKVFHCFICDTSYSKWSDHVATTDHDANAAELVRRLEYLSQRYP